MQRETFLYKKATEYLSKLIVQHYDDEGYRLPTEADTCREVGVSRITARKAYTILEEHGLIIRSKRGGTRINKEIPLKIVLSILHSNGYLHNGAREKSNTIAVILPHIMGSHHVTNILSAIIDNHVNETIIVDKSSMSINKEQELIDKYIAMNVDGIILYPVDNEIYNPTLLQLSMAKFPLVLVDRLLPGLTLPCVSSDHEDMVRLASNHLLRAGHKHILFFNANIKTNSSLAIRKESYINSLYSAHNYRPYFYSFEGDADPTSLSFCNDFREYLDANAKISAIISADYSSGLHLTKILETLGPSYKERFEVVYLDFNSMQFEPFVPAGSTTYVMQDSYRIGREAIKLMQSALEGCDISNSKIIVPSKIVTSYNPNNTGSKS